MTLKQIDYMNIGLMLAALVVAFSLPFELFLFSYAVLGPLHYLTEISWLEKKHYFTTGKKDYLILVSICILYAILFFYSKYGIEKHDIEQKKTVALWTNHLIFLAFASALAMVIFTELWKKLLLITAALLVAQVLRDNQNYLITFSVFMPTLIHVSIFTGAFMLFGALKARSETGLIAFVVFVLCGLACFVITYIDNSYLASQDTQKTYLESGFAIVNRKMSDIIDPVERYTEFHLFISKLGIMIQRFIAFAYTYHYLNWFSKTSIIKWNKVSKIRMGVILVLWVAAVSLYYINYNWGILGLLLLSMLHVFLEFPLNYRSFIGIYQELKIIAKTRSFKPAK